MCRRSADATIDASLRTSPRPVLQPRDAPRISRAAAPPLEAMSVVEDDGKLEKLKLAPNAEIGAAKGSDLGRFPLVSADFWTSDHLSERSRSVGAVFETRARETLTLKRR